MRGATQPRARHRRRRVRGACFRHISPPLSDSAVRRTRLDASHRRTLYDAQIVARHEDDASGGV